MCFFPYPELYEEFFGLLRSWYEKARNRSHWKKLRLAIAYSTNIYMHANTNQLPLSIGLPIELPELTKEEVQIFAQQYGLVEDSFSVDPLIQLVGGHPYLLKLAFFTSKIIQISPYTSCYQKPLRMQVFIVII
jgi:hypothetical protein